MSKFTCQTHRQHLEIKSSSNTHVLTYDGSPVPHCKLLEQGDPAPGSYPKQLRGLDGEIKTDTCIIVQDA